MVITQHGEAKAVLQDIASYEQTQEAIMSAAGGDWDDKAVRPTGRPAAAPGSDWLDLPRNPDSARRRAGRAASIPAGDAGIPQDSDVCERRRAGPLSARPESRRIGDKFTYRMTSRTFGFSNLQSQNMSKR
jgi:hypothetical protein